MNKRKVVVEIQTGDDQVTRYDGLNVTFEVTKTTDSVMNTAKIRIANLSLDNIYYLTTITSPHDKSEEPKLIRLLAGYGKDVPMIFEGTITKAIPTMPPDIWLECEAKTGYFKNQNVISLGMNGKTSVKKICEETAARLDLQLEYLATTDKSVESFCHSGGANNLITRINDLGGVIAYDDDGVLKVVDADNPKVGEDVQIVNKDTGLIGVPQFNQLGVKIKMLLQPTFVLGSRIQLESWLLKKMSGVYWSYAIKHYGGLREHDFYTEIDAKHYTGE